MFLAPTNLGCAFLQESLEFPGIRRNLGSKKNELCSFFAGTSKKGWTDRKGMLKNTFLFCRNVKNKAKPGLVKKSGWYFCRYANGGGAVASTLSCNNNVNNHVNKTRRTFKKKEEEGSSRRR